MKILQYKVIIHFTASVRDGNRYSIKNFQDEFLLSLPDNFKFPTNKIFYDIVDLYYGIHPIDVLNYNMEVFEP